MSFSMLPAVNVAIDERQDEEQPDPEDGGDAEHQRDAALADLDALVLRLEAGGADEPARAHHEGLVEHDETADERPLGGATCRGPCPGRGVPWA